MSKNIDKRDKLNTSETKIKINKEENIKQFIENNSKKILNNTLNDFIKDENYINLKNDIFKKEIFYFASFINSCKKYENIKELKKDIKNFLKNKNENIEYHYHILLNFSKQLLNIISSPKFFKEKENIKSLIKILKRFDKSLISSQGNDKIKYVDIKKNVISEYKAILDIFKKNNLSEQINKFIEQLTDNIITIENNFLDNKKENIIIEKQNKNILINNCFKEKENNNLNHKIILKGKEDKKDNNLYETKIIFNKKEKKLHVINNHQKKYNYENIMFPPIQNNDDSFYK